MFHFNDCQLKIDLASSPSWGARTAYAAPRPFNALSFRLSGNADYFHGETTVHVQTNDVLFVPADYDYTISSHANEQVLVVHFYLDKKVEQGIQVLTPANPDIFERLFSELCQTWRNKKVGYKYKATSLLYQIFEQIEIQETKQQFPIKTQKFQAAVEYLHSYFSSPDTTVESTARHINTSTAYLRKLFRLNMQTSPLQYLNRLRIDYATELLKTGYYTVEEIATRSGFCDAKYFATVYKKYKKVSPSSVMKSTANQTL